MLFIATRRPLLYKPPVAVVGGSTTTFNPSDKGANVSLSGGDLTATNSVGANGNVRSVASYSSGKFYRETTITASNTAYNHGVAFGNSSASLTAGPGSPDTNSGCYYNGDNNVYVGGGGTNLGSSYTTGDIVSMALDLDNNRVWYRVNGGNWNGNASYDPATNTGGIVVGITKPIFAMAAVTKGAVNTVQTTNFGATAYTYTPPSGFGNW